MPHSGLPERFLIAPYALSLTVSVALLSKFITSRKFVATIVLILIAYSVYMPIRFQISRARAAANPSPNLKVLYKWPFTETLDYIPDSSHILFVGSQGVPDYPLFRPQTGYKNIVIPWGKQLFNSSRMQDLMERNHITHVLVENDQALDFAWDPPVPTTEMVEWLVNHPGFSEVSVTTKSMRLFETQQAKEARQQEIERGMEKAQVGLQTSLVIIDPSLRNQVAIDTSSLTVPWPLESKQQHRDILWLGHGHSAGLSGVLWSREHRKVLLRFYLTHGPGQNDKLCSVQLSGLANGHVITGVRRLNESTSRLDFPLSPQTRP